MRILITGGTGLIGKALCPLLLADGHLVTILSRDPDESRGMPKGVRIEKWDGETTAGWGHLVNGTEAIINLAGAGIADQRWSASRKKLIRESRIHAGLAIQQAIQQAKQKPTILIQASAVGYYGTHADDRLITETAPPGTDFLAKVCFDWEMSTAPVERMGIRRPIIRTGIVLSKAGGALPKMMLPFKFLAGGPLGNGKQWMPWIHITDTARAIKFLLDTPNATGPFNLAAPNPLTNAQFSEILGATMRRPAFIPTPSIALQAALGEMSTMVIDGQRVVPQKLEALGFAFSYPSAREALGQLLQ
ncbi:MAG: TIGR01777 family oxidoreductase [Caldilineaceae bacterium]|nr:TIGR01777 family oxidoreductase [Caldilineaceae bacterium]